MTSVSFTVGAKSLLQLGVSLTDIALLINIGQKFGNFLRVSKNEESLFEALGEDSEALLRRRGLVEPARMESIWPDIGFIYEGETKTSTGARSSEQRALSSFSWLMITIITALDLCMSRFRVEEMLVDVLAMVLDRKEEVEESLRIMLPTSVESWRSMGRVRRMDIRISKQYASTRERFAEPQIIPHLNLLEEKEMKSFLTWLLSDNKDTFRAMCVDIYAFASSIGAAGIHVGTGDSRQYESETFVTYVKDIDTIATQIEPKDPGQYLQIGSAQQVSYRFGKPEDVVHSIQAPRKSLNLMSKFWEDGAASAKHFKLVARCQLPWGPTSEVYYHIEGAHEPKYGFTPNILRLQSPTFPAPSHGISCALEEITKQMSSGDIMWLNQHTQLEHLRRVDTISTGESQQLEAFLQYEALVFGFYYELMKPLIVSDGIDEQSFFQGIWGYKSNVFLRMCTELGYNLSEEQGASRAQLLYMISSMFNGRTKPYVEGSSRRGLVGILGSISVVTLPLMRAVDTPSEISKFMLCDLPIIDLAPENDGEIYAGTGSGIRFDNEPILQSNIIPRAPSKKWTMHAKMGVKFAGSSNGVIMAARCDGRLVGWFNPLVADVLFLTTAYCAQEGEQSIVDHDEPTSVLAVEAKDNDWQCGIVPRPARQDAPDGFIVVHSLGCPVLRYAATGFFGNAGDEIAISTGDVSFAYGRMELQESGVIIA
jgi:hypothetical protein